MDQKFSSRTAALPLLLQGMMVPVALLAALFYPTTNHPAMLISLTGQSPATAIGWGRAHGAALVGLSIDGRTANLRLSSAGSALAALRSGFLPLAADNGLCTPEGFDS